MQRPRFPDNRRHRHAAIEQRAQLRIFIRLRPRATRGTKRRQLRMLQFQVLRLRYPENILIHERYQDAVQRYGVEGHLKSLTEDYEALDVQHKGNPIYHYLYLRSLIGYSTPAAIDGHHGAPITHGLRKTCSHCCIACYQCSNLQEVTTIHPASTHLPHIYDCVPPCAEGHSSPTKVKIQN